MKKLLLILLLFSSCKMTKYTGKQVHCHGYGYTLAEHTGVKGNN